MTTTRLSRTALLSKAAEQLKAGTNPFGVTGCAWDSGVTDIDVLQLSHDLAAGARIVCNALENPMGTPAHVARGYGVEGIPG